MNLEAKRVWEFWREADAALNEVHLLMRHVDRKLSARLPIAPLSDSVLAAMKTSVGRFEEKFALMAREWQERLGR